MMKFKVLLMVSLVLAIGASCSKKHKTNVVPVPKAQESVVDSEEAKAKDLRKDFLAARKEVLAIEKKLRKDAGVKIFSDKKGIKKDTKKGKAGLFLASFLIGLSAEERENVGELCQAALEKIEAIYNQDLKENAEMVVQLENGKEVGIGSFFANKIDGLRRNINQIDSMK